MRAKGALVVLGLAVSAMFSGCGKLPALPGGDSGAADASAKIEVPPDSRPIGEQEGVRCFVLPLTKGGSEIVYLDLTNNPATGVWYAAGGGGVTVNEFKDGRNDGVEVSRSGEQTRVCHWVRGKKHGIETLYGTSGILKRKSWKNGVGTDL